MSSAIGAVARWISPFLAVAAVVAVGMTAAPVTTGPAPVVRLAADGLWYSDLFGIAAPQGADRDRLIERLLALAAGGSK